MNSGDGGEEPDFFGAPAQCCRSGMDVGTGLGCVCSEDAVLPQQGRCEGALVVPELAPDPLVHLAC